MHIIYIDDSGDENIDIFSALAVDAEYWNQAFQRIREFRRQIKQLDGILVYKELHAWKFVSGRGHIADRVVPKGRRCEIFKEALHLLASMEGVFW